MKIHIPAFRAMAVCNEHLNHEAFDIELSEQALKIAGYIKEKHGRWAHLGGDEWCCTNCGEVISTEGSWDKPIYKHCHECGAKMDLEENVHD